MRRKLKSREKHPVSPDYQYDSEIVARFVNYVMLDGKKESARQSVYKALDKIKEDMKVDNPAATLEEAVKNVGPLVEVRSRRIGGANYQVPREVRPERRIALAMRWIVQAARAKKGRPIAEKLAEEIMLAVKNEGDAVRKRENIHKMAEANKAFAHFAF